MSTCRRLPRRRVKSPRVTRQNSAAMRSDISQSGGKMGPWRSSNSMRWRFNQLKRLSTLSSHACSSLSLKALCYGVSFYSESRNWCVGSRSDWIRKYLLDLYTYGSAIVISDPDLERIRNSIFTLKITSLLHNNVNLRRKQQNSLQLYLNIHLHQRYLLVNISVGDPIPNPNIEVPLELISVPGT